MYEEQTNSGTFIQISILRSPPCKRICTLQKSIFSWKYRIEISRRLSSQSLTWQNTKWRMPTYKKHILWTTWPKNAAAAFIQTVQNEKACWHESTFTIKEQPLESKLCLALFWGFLSPWTPKTHSYRTRTGIRHELSEWFAIEIMAIRVVNSGQMPVRVWCVDKPNITDCSMGWHYSFLFFL